MKLTRTQTEALKRITRTQKRAEDAAAEAEDAILAALDCGVPQTRVAEAANVPRMTFLRRYVMPRKAGPQGKSGVGA